MPPDGFIGAGLLSETYSLNSPFHFTDFLYPYRPAFSGFKSFLHITAFHLCLRAQMPMQKTAIIPVKADVKQFRKFHSLSVHDAGTRQGACIINFYYSRKPALPVVLYTKKYSQPEPAYAYLRGNRLNAPEIHKLFQDPASR